jgi:hypothetical protein
MEFYMPTLRQLIESNVATSKIADALVAGRKSRPRRSRGMSEEIAGKGFVFFAVMNKVAKILSSKRSYAGRTVDNVDFVTSGPGIREGNGRLQFTMTSKDSPEKYVELHCYQNGKLDIFYVNEETGSSRTKTSGEITEWKKSELMAAQLLKIAREHLEKFQMMYQRGNTASRGI